MKIDSYEKETIEQNALDQTEVKGAAIDVGTKLPWKEMGLYAVKTGAKYFDHWLDNHDLPDSVPFSKKHLQAWLKLMYAGQVCRGEKTLGLKDIGEWKLSNQMPMKDLKQHAGVSAEIISVTKENIASACNDSEVNSVRTVDLSGGYQVDNAAVNKVRLDGNGEIISRVSTKFVGRDGLSCLKKLVSKKWDTVLTAKSLDKVEIPKDFYDDIKKNNLIGKELEKLKIQLEKVKELKKEDVVKILEKLILRYMEIDTLLERSTVSSNEALYATVYPERYVSRITAEESIKDGDAEGLKPGVATAGLNFCKSIISNEVKQEIVLDSESYEEILDEELENLTEEIQNVPFISREVSIDLEASSHELVGELKTIGIPAELTDYAIMTFDTAMDFAAGEIRKDEFIKAMAGLATHIGTKYLIKVIVKALGKGSEVGVVLSIVTDIAQYALQVNAFKTAEQYNSASTAELLMKAKKTANSLIDKADDYKQGAGNVLKAAIDKFNRKNGIQTNLA